MESDTSFLWIGKHQAGEPWHAQDCPGCLYGYGVLAKAIHIILLMEGHSLPIIIPTCACTISLDQIKHDLAGLCFLRNCYSVRSYHLIFSKPFSWLVLRKGGCPKLLLCKHGESSIIIEYKPCRTVRGCCLVRSWCVKRCLHMRHTSSICRIIQKHLSQIACISLGKHVYKWIYQYICLSISFWTPHSQLKDQRPFCRKSFPTDWLAGFSNNPRI